MFMGIANNNFQYNEQEPRLLTGWYKVNITSISEVKPTRNGDATGFWINFDVRVGDRFIDRSVWLSFDHPSEFVTTRSNNIGAMMRMMFPAVIDDRDYEGQSFWLLFKTYKEKATGKERESFFDSKHNVSPDGRANLYGEPIEREDETPPPKASVPRSSVPQSNVSSDDVPF